MELKIKIEERASPTGKPSLHVNMTGEGTASEMEAVYTTAIAEAVQFTVRTLNRLRIGGTGYEADTSTIDGVPMNNGAN